MLVIFELLFFLAFVLFIVTQLIIPILLNTSTFPSFRLRTKFQELNDTRALLSKAEMDRELEALRGKLPKEEVKNGEP